MESSTGTNPAKSSCHPSWTGAPVLPLQCPPTVGGKLSHSVAVRVRCPSLPFAPCRKDGNGCFKQLPSGVISTCIVVFTCILAYRFMCHILLQMQCVHCIVDGTTSSVFSLRGQSRKYNNLFAFTAMGVTGTERFVPQPVPSCVKIHGRTYHRVLPANMQGPVHW